MPRFGSSIEKTTLFRGVQQVFANVYYWEMPSIGPDRTGALNRFLDVLVAKEKGFHAGSVNFIRGRVWSTGLGREANTMIVDKGLTGTGNRSAAANMDRERAILVRWPAGKNTRGKPVYLRKWYHTICGSVGVPPDQNALQNTGPLQQAIRDDIQAQADGFRNVQDIQTPAGLDNWGLASLVAQSGRQTTGPAEVHLYLEHHQLGDMWRG